MKTSAFTYVLQHPNTIDEQVITDLKSIIEEYPFFQAPKAVYLKGLKALDSFKYNEILKQTAALTTDRSILFDFITSEDFDQHQVAKKISSQAPILEDIHVEIEEVIAENLSPKEAIKNVSDSESFISKMIEEDEVESTDTMLEDHTEFEELSLGKPLDFNKDEKHSFAEWLKITSIKPIIRKDIPDESLETKEEESSIQEDQNTLAKKEKFKLIDKFIKDAPKIIPDKETTSSLNLARQKLTEKTELMTETLARVYLEQKKYKKAIQAYKILSLKYPEKSGFFADQIQAVKKLQQHNS